jgi:hypothetical protein
LHGRSGVIYVSVQAGQAASPLAFLSDWSISFTGNRADVTSIIDTTVRWTAVNPDISGDFSGYIDTATAQTYTATLDGLPRNLYLYPSVNLGRYFTGMILPDFEVGGGIGAAVSLKSTWNAASQITLQSTGGGPTLPGYGPVYTATYPGSAEVGFTSTAGLAVPGLFTPGSPGA